MTAHYRLRHAMMPSMFMLRYLLLSLHPTLWGQRRLLTMFIIDNSLCFNEEYQLSLVIITCWFKLPAPPVDAYVRATVKRNHYRLCHSPLLAEVNR
jgi:hypothetical protein